MRRFKGLHIEESHGGVLRIPTAALFLCAAVARRGLGEVMDECRVHDQPTLSGTPGITLKIPNWAGSQLAHAH